MAHKKKLRKAWLWLRIREVRTKRWWWKQDRRFGGAWRIGNGAAAVLILVAVVIPVLQYVAFNNSYRLSAEALQLVGQTNPTLEKQLGFDAKTQSFTFNQSAIKDDSGTANPFSAMQTQVGTASGQGNDKSLYALDVAQDMAKGVTYHDVNTGLSFSLVPQFTGSPGKIVDNHLVYPLGGGTQAVYTLKNNGLKEDIVVARAKSDIMTFQYKLNLPGTLEAKIIPGSGGDIGIYGADPTLYGNISYGSDSDRAAVENARKNGAKDHLVFGLPSPVIKDLHGNIVGNAHFNLDGDNISVVANGLNGQKLPVTIDPSVVVTSAADFGAGNNEGNIDFSTSGQITRGGLTGGTVSGGWTSTSALNTASYNLATAVYNGYMYVLSGQVSGGSAANSVQYATINSGGTVGAWHYTHNSTDDSTSFVAGFTNTRTNFEAVAYNGYLYVIGGLNSGGTTVYGDVQYAPLNSNGTVGTWSSSSSLTATRYGSAAAAYKGYLYVAGGCTSVSGGVCSGFSSSVERAAVNADGTLGTWTTTGNSSMTTTRINVSGVAYNGYLYALGGCVSISSGSCTSLLSSTEYAPINADGTVGTWSTTTSFTTGRQSLGAVASGGYMYIMGGSTTLNDIQYAPIYASGSLGSWGTSATFTTARFGLATAASGGYLYIVGGCSVTASNCASGIQSDVQYAKVDTSGVMANYATTSTGQNSSGAGVYDTQANALSFPTAAAYNGYLYLIGGLKITGNTSQAVILHAAINSDGTLGTWSPTTRSLLTSRYGAAAVVYNGYLYVTGGFHTTGSTLTDVEYAPIASSGDITTAFQSNAGFTTGRFHHSAVIYNDNLYILGGRSATNQPLSDIQYASITSTGTLGSWSTATVALPTVLGAFGAVSYGGYLYILGGNSGNSVGLSTVNYTKFDSGGNITTSFTSATPFTTARWGLSAYASNGYLYIVGGITNSTALSDTQYTPIGSNGAPGSWTATTSLSGAARYGGQTATYNGVLYLIGGCTTKTVSGLICSTNATTLRDVQYATINNGGSGAAGSWASGSNNLINTRSNVATVAYNGYLYSLGGRNGATLYADVQYAPIGADGTVGAWHYTHNSTDDSTSFVSGLPSQLYGLSAVAYNGYLYAIGGTGGSGDTSTVYYAPLNSNGTVGTWATTSSLITNESGLGAAVYNGYLYVAGGTVSPTNGVAYAPINGNGTLNAWHYTHSSTDDSTSFVSGFTNGRNGLSLFAYAGYLYVVGGVNGSTYYNDVQYAPLNSNGTVGTWTYTSGFANARSNFGAGIYDGVMYVSGGTNGSSLNDIQYAPLNIGGMVGAWQTLPTTFTNARSGQGSVVYGGKLYMVAGNGASYYNDVQSTSLQSIARAAHYSKVIDLGSVLNVTGVSLNGSLPGGLTSVSYARAGANAVFGSSAQASQISGSGGCIGTTANTRYLFLMVTLDDSYGQSTGGLYADPAGTSADATLTDLTVNYSTVHVIPQVRLRSGASLQSGNLTPLDTCGA